MLLIQLRWRLLQRSEILRSRFLVYLARDNLRVFFLYFFFFSLWNYNLNNIFVAKFILFFGVNWIYQFCLLNDRLINANNLLYLEKWKMRFPQCFRCKSQNATTSSSILHLFLRFFKKKIRKKNSPSRKVSVISGSARQARYTRVIFFIFSLSLLNQAPMINSRRRRGKLKEIFFSLTLEYFTFSMTPIKHFFFLLEIFYFMIGVKKKVILSYSIYSLLNTRLYRNDQIPHYVSHDNTLECMSTILFLDIK